MRRNCGHGGIKDDEVHCAIPCWEGCRAKQPRNLQNSCSIMSNLAAEECSAPMCTEQLHWRLVEDKAFSSVQLIVFMHTIHFCAKLQCVLCFCSPTFVLTFNMSCVYAYLVRGEGGNDLDQLRQVCLDQRAALGCNHALSTNCLQDHIR